MQDQKLNVTAPLTWALLFTVSLGCGAPQKPVEAQPVKAQPVQTPPVETPAKPPSLTLRMDAISASKGAFELQPGDTLRAGDRMAVNVSVDQPAYVYVALGSASGPPKVVFPKSGDQQVSPTQPLRIPANPEKWIVLDDQTGQEDVFVYASPKPISTTELTNLVTADAAASKKVAKKSATAKAVSAKPKSASKPKADDGALSAGSRGVQIEEDEGEAAPAAPSNPNIVSKRFSVSHK